MQSCILINIFYLGNHFTCLRYYYLVKMWISFCDVLSKCESVFAMSQEKGNQFLWCLKKMWISFVMSQENVNQFLRCPRKCEQVLCDTSQHNVNHFFICQQNVLVLWICFCVVSTKCESWSILWCLDTIWESVLLSYLSTNQISNTKMYIEL